MRDYETLAEWRVERAAGDPRYGDATDALVAIAIVLYELAELLDDELVHKVTSPSAGERGEGAERVR